MTAPSYCSATTYHKIDDAWGVLGRPLGRPLTVFETVVAMNLLNWVGNRPAGNAFVISEQDMSGRYFNRTIDRLFRLHRPLIAARQGFAVLT